MTSKQEEPFERVMKERIKEFNTSRQTVERAVKAFWLGQGATLKAQTDNETAPEQWPLDSRRISPLLRQNRTRPDDQRARMCRDPTQNHRRGSGPDPT